MRATLEVCVDTLEGLMACVEGGADRIELCSALPLGGLTPSHGLMRAAAECGVPAYAMIRPRQGDFCFSEREIGVMLDDIAAAREAGLAGVVLGAASPQGTLDEVSLAALCAASDGMGRTLHRVIDTVDDRLAAVETAISLGFERILTSGGALTVIEGVTELGLMQRHARGRIEIMAGSGVSMDNVADIARATGIWSFHASCSEARQTDSALSAFGFTTQFERKTSAQLVRSLKIVLDEITVPSSRIADAGA
ncbi:copper homeostasis protein CutC [Nitratireductor sp. GISD-1A_MAKvit]|uniref:copper homeostasis protein CutC n=1 Tax=Nitratireductor sp. GISD-1A_MAKvit TaxID=3234198 RepID=UPI0034666628